MEDNQITQAKKIGILAGIYPPDIGGPAVYSARLAEELTIRDKEVTVICYSEKGFQRIEKVFDWSFKVVGISRKLGFLRFLSYLYHTLRLVRGSDILYAQTLFSAGIPGLIAGKIFRKKAAVKITGDHAWERFNKGETVEEFQNKKYGWRVQLVKKMQIFLLKRFSKIIVPSQYLKKIISSWGVPPQKIVVIYNAPDSLPDLVISQKEAQEKIGVEGDVILSVGRLMSWKGFDSLIEIIPELLKENPNFHLVIVGEGPERQNLELRIKNSGLEEKVKLVGKVSHDKMYLYFGAADLFVLNTGYEGLSHVILEAMQAGLPIITTNIGGNPELIEDGQNGILIDPGNKEQLKSAILRLSKDKALQEKFRQNSKEILKAFTWQNVIDETLEVLNSL